MQNLCSIRVPVIQRCINILMQKFSRGNYQQLFSFLSVSVDQEFRKESLGHFWLGVLHVVSLSRSWSRSMQRLARISFSMSSQGHSFIWANLDLLSGWQHLGGRTSFMETRGSNMGVPINYSEAVLCFNDLSQKSCRITSTILHCFHGHYDLLRFKGCHMSA